MSKFRFCVAAGWRLEFVEGVALDPGRSEDYEIPDMAALHQVSQQDGNIAVRVESGAVRLVNWAYVVYGELLP